MYGLSTSMLLLLHSAFMLRALELEVLSLSHLYSLKTEISHCHYVIRNDIMRFLVLGFRSDIRIELQAPVLRVVKMLLKEEVGGSALNNHGNYIADHGKSWKNHGIVFLNFCGNPVIRL